MVMLIGKWNNNMDFGIHFKKITVLFHHSTFVLFAEQLSDLQIVKIARKHFNKRQSISNEWNSFSPSTYLCAYNE